MKNYKEYTHSNRKYIVKIYADKDEQKYIESTAARMGVDVQAVVDAIIKARTKYATYTECKAGKAETDIETYNLRKELMLAQARPADEIVKYKSYTFRAGDAARLLKALDREFTKPNKKQMALFEAEAAAEAAAPMVEDLAAAVDAHFQELADNAPADDVEPAAAPLVQAAKESGRLIVCSVPKPDPDSEKTEETPAPAPVKKAKKFAVYRGAVVEVLDEWTEGDTGEIVVKIKGGSRMAVDAADLKATDAKKCTLPECFTDGGLLMHNGVLCRIEYIGSTRIELYYMDEEEYSSGQIVAVLHDWEPAPVEQAAEEPAPVSMAPVVAAPLAVVPVAPLALTPRRRPDFRARWRRLLTPARYLAALVVVLVLSMLLGSSSGAFDTPADDAAADVVTAAAEAAPALVVELEPVIISAPAVKKAADPQPPAVRTPSGQKTAPASVTPAADDDETTADTMNEPEADQDGGTQPAPAFTAPSVPAGFSACFVAMYSTIMNNIN